MKKGNYIGNTAPFGYDKVHDKIGPTIKPNEYADAVRLAFDMYVNQDKTYLEIARYLDSIGVKPMKGKIWEKSSIRAMLKNEHYAGWVRFGGHKTERFYENGQMVKKRNMPVDPEEVILEKGRHVPLVTQEMFDAARAKLDNNPKAKWDAPLRNVLSGLFFCKKCGRAMAQHPYKNARDRYECRNRAGCGTKSAFMDEVIEAVICSLEREELPKLQVRLKNNDGSGRKIQQAQLAKLRSELAELQVQEERQFDLLEKGTYSEDIFARRNKALHEEMDALKTRIYELNKEMPKEVDYQNMIVKLEDAISGLRDDRLTPLAKNKLLKAIIDRIDYEVVGYEGKGKVRYKLHIQLKL